MVEQHLNSCVITCFNVQVYRFLFEKMSKEEVTCKRRKVQKS